MSMEYCHKHGMYYDTDYLEACGMCHHDEPLRTRETQEPDIPETGKVFCGAGWLLPELWREDPIGFRMGYRSYTGFGKRRDE